VKRLIEFIRSVIPADPVQLVFLAGVVCLIVARGLRWSPPGLASAVPSAGRLGPWLLYGGAFFVYPVIFAAVAGYFVCFWPGPHPVRRVFWFVCAPALLGLGLLFGRIVYLSGPPASVLESTGGILARQLNLARSILPELPQGFQFALLGLLLICLFVSRLAVGVSSLPLALPGAQLFRAEDSAEWARLQFVVFTIVGPLFLIHVFLSFVAFEIPFFISSRAPARFPGIWFSESATILGTMAACVVLLGLMGRENRKTVWDSIRWPDRISVLLAVAFPVGAGALISTGHFLIDRALWAARDFGKLSPPEFGGYFEIPNPRLLLLFFAAFSEEIIFRGLLQNRFIRRYGAYRGIFLVGIVWAAFHFFSDFSFSRYTGLAIPMQLSFRVFICVALSFVLGWLTFRSGSVVPAAIAHTLYNVLAFSELWPKFPGGKIVVVGLWAVLAMLLYRHWPPHPDDPQSRAVAPSPEFAT
jgi:membrane protease YdiL (CAAX protease family)